MNLQETIDTLAKQCYSYDHLSFDYNRFAKMIAVECARKLEEDGMVEVAMEMKQHFGVE